jgi:integrase
VGFQPNSPELRLLRGKEPMEGWVSLFARRDPERAKRYEDALSLLLGHAEAKGTRPAWADMRYFAKSPKTRRAYRAAIAEFFEFVARLHGKIIAPDEVTRKDALEYAEWLTHRGKTEGGHDRYQFSLDVERLRDGDRDAELAIYEAVRELGKAKLTEISRLLPARVRAENPPTDKDRPAATVDEAWLTDRLLWLMGQRILVRSPRLSDLRDEDPNAARDKEHIIDPELFTYALRPLQPVSRSTVANRLAALSSFWRILQQGENTAEQPLLKYNVFEEPVRIASRGLQQERRESRRSKRLDPKLIERLLAAAEGPRLSDKRNLALLWFLLLVGARIEEAVSLRRGPPQTETDRKLWPGWLELGEQPPVLVVRRKGNRIMRLPVPSYVLASLKSVTEELLGRGKRANPNEPAYRYQLLATQPDAPVFPSLRLWGKNQHLLDSAEYGQWSYKKGLGQQAVSMLLDRLAEKAGITVQERRKIHPHAFRHAAAEAMVAGGKPIREVQAILGHASVTTTEGYLPDELDVVKLSGQREILDWLEQKGVHVRPPAGAEGERAAPPEARPTVIQTRGYEVEKPAVEFVAARREPAVIEAEFIEEAPPRECRVFVVDPEPEKRPYGLPEGAPAAPAAPLLLLPQPREKPELGRVTVVGSAASDPAPTRPYEEMARGQKPADIAWVGRPRSRFIEKTYPELPERFGIGEESLLVWWNKDAPLPWPVLAPVQAYPEIRTQGFVAMLESLYDEWEKEAPSKALSLARWYFYLGSVTAGLEGKLEGAYSWVSFNAFGSIGEDLRAHDNDWLIAWFRKNAALFTVAQRRFAAIGKPLPGEEADAYWERIRRDVEVASAIPAVPHIPDWFYEPDPVLAIYQRDPKEWKSFAAWLGRLTGVAESPARENEKVEQLDFFEGCRENEEARAKGLLEEYYGYLDEWASSGRELRTDLREQMERLRKALKDAYNIDVPTTPPKEKTEDRIERFLRKAFPERKPRARENVLGSGRLFSPEAFRIDPDPARHTIAHTKEFSVRFSEEHYGRDSECVMRRVARALWEKVRETELGLKPRRLTSAELERELFVTELATMAYVVPCASEMEEVMRASGIRYARPADISRAVEERILEAARGRAKDTEVDQVALDILESYFEHLPPEVEPEVRLELAHQQELRRRHEREKPLEPERAREEKAARRRRKLEPNGRVMRKNARSVLPHPLALVAASFWPT